MRDGKGEKGSRRGEEEIREGSHVKVKGILF